MGRKKQRAPASPGEPAKYSFLVPIDLDRKIRETCGLRGLASQSVLLRQILEDNIDRYLAAAAADEPSPPGVGTVVRVELNEQVREALAMAARDYNLDLAAFIRLTLAEMLGEILARARKHRDSLSAVVERERKQRSPGATPPHV
jgi:hypothetical protein